MSQRHQLINTLKRLLKHQGITYAMVARHLGLSEASVKRLFSQQNFSLLTLESICQLLQMELSELVQAVEDNPPAISQLDEAQEQELVCNPTLLLVAVCALNHWPLSRMVQTYQISEAECISHLIRLDRLGMIRLLPENRIRLRITRQFSWRPGGPIHQFFRQSAQTDFLDAHFDQPADMLRFQHAMLSPSNNQYFQKRLQQLLEEFNSLHNKDSTSDTYTEGTCLLIALRPWEPAMFEKRRRE